MILQTVIDHFGVTVASISGVLAARGRRIDLFGVVVLALVTAFGGGTIRDVTLGDVPVFWVRDLGFIGNAAATAVATFYIARFLDYRHGVLMVADALVLAIFTMAGAQKAMAFHTTPGAVVFLGVTTGVAGGIMRDLLTGEIPLVFRQQIYLYATASFLGAFSFLLLESMGASDHVSVLVGLIVTLAVRLAGIRWRIALPLFEARDDRLA
jgi:uncharacterized membrane protein YeiH